MSTFPTTIKEKALVKTIEPLELPFTIFLEPYQAIWKWTTGPPQNNWHMEITYQTDEDETTLLIIIKPETKEAHEHVRLLINSVKDFSTREVFNAGDNGEYRWE